MANDEEVSKRNILREFENLKSAVIYPESDLGYRVEYFPHNRHARPERIIKIENKLDRLAEAMGYKWSEEPPNSKEYPKWEKKK